MRRLDRKECSIQGFFTRSRSAALILVLLIGCLSALIKQSPALDISLYKDLSSSKSHDLSEIAELAKTNFVGFARNLKQWSANSVVYLIKLIVSSGEVDKLMSLQFSNLTCLLEDPFIDGYLSYPKVDHSWGKNEEIHEQEGEIEEELLEETLENGAIYEEADDSEEAFEGHYIEEEHLAHEVEVVESGSSELLAHDQEQSSDIHSLPSYGAELKTEVVELLEIKSGTADAGEVEGAKTEFFEVEVNPKSLLESSILYVDVPSSESVGNSATGSENKSSVLYVHKISLLVSAFVAAIAVTVVYFKSRRITTPSPAVLDPFLAKKLRTSTPQSQIWPADVDVVGESCPSEMSSFQNRMSYSKREAENETHSQENKQWKMSKRRESLASSSDYSMGCSPSYGSFTTYEKIPIKHGSEEDEIVTPVRRSSRFKNQVTPS